MTLSLVICKRCGGVLNGFTHATEEEFLDDLTAVFSQSVEEARERFERFAADRRALHAQECPA